MGDLIKIEKNEIEETNGKENRIVDLDLTDVDKGNAIALLNLVVENFQIAKEKFSDIEPEKRYYLDLTKEMRDMLEKGEAWFTEKGANGKPMGQLRHRVDGKNVIMANPDIVEEQIVNTPELDPKQMTNAVYQMALQQQIAELSYKIDELQHIVKRIEEGQMDDRFAKIDSGEETLRIAYCTANEKNRMALVANAIASLQEGSESIKRVIRRRLNEFEKIPSKGRSLRWKMWKSPTNYVEKKDQEFDNIQNCFEYYDRAQKLTAIACMMMGEPGAMEEIFFQQEKFIDSLDTWKLKSIRHLHYNVDLSNEWFFDPKKYLDGTRLEYLDFTKENYNVVSLEVTGEQMLEALNND